MLIALSNCLRVTAALSMMTFLSAASVTAMNWATSQRNDQTALCALDSALVFAFLSAVTWLLTMASSMLLTDKAQTTKSAISTTPKPAANRAPIFILLNMIFLLSRQAMSAVDKVAMSVDRAVDQRHIGAGHEFFDVEQDQHATVRRSEPGDVAGVEGGR